MAERRPAEELESLAVWNWKCGQVIEELDGKTGPRPMRARPAGVYLVRGAPLTLGPPNAGAAWRALLATADGRWKFK